MLISAMEWRLVIIFLVLLLKTVDRAWGSCNLSLKEDFGSPSPVFLHNGGLLTPKTADGILLRRGETLQVACPGNGKFVMLGNDTKVSDVVDIKCVINSTFRSKTPQWVGQLKEVHCNAPPWSTAEKTATTCYGGHHIYRIGYKIRDVFFTLYEACFDSISLSTRYVKHELTNSSTFLQQSSRPQFIEGGVFGKVRMSDIYREAHQRDRINQLMGPGMDGQYITKKQQLTRGHLAAKADFSMSAYQRATFQYINTAPQWRRGNSGDWAALEEALRRRLKTYKSPVVVYTGTHGVCTLPDKSGTPRELYLHTDENNNDILPVPLYFYKLVYDPCSKVAVAFISINLPYYDTNAIEKLLFCNDICEGDSRYSWLRWRANDATHSFCCEYHEFVSEISSLPKLDVRGLFY